MLKDGERSSNILSPCGGVNRYAKWELDIMNYNIFDFATSELSHSAFYAWLIAQLAHDSDCSQKIREQGLRFINKCLEVNEIEKISRLADINSIKVQRELSHIDIVAFITTKNKKNIGIIIENKVGSQESRKHQLLDYYKDGQKLIENHFNTTNYESAFIYLKSDYDYDDSLNRFDSNRKVISTNFKKINYENIYTLFKSGDFPKDSIVENYASWIKKKHESIQRQMNTVELLSSSNGVKLLTSDHVGQVHLIKTIFSKLFSGKIPFCAEKDKNGYYRWYYEPNIFFKLGTDKGDPWTELWFSEKYQFDLGYFYRLQLNKPKPLLHARLGYWGSKERIKEKEILHENYVSIRNKHSLTKIQSKFAFKPNNYVSTLSAFNLIGNTIEELQQIEKLHLEFFGT